MQSKTQIIQHLEMYHLHQTALCENKQTSIYSLDQSMVMAWIYHDHLLEGRSFEPEEIKIAINKRDQELPTYLHPLLEDIRLYESAIKQTCTYASKGTSNLSLNKLQKMHKLLMTYEPKEGARIRTNSPVHRDYHQEICAHSQVSSLLKSFYRDVQNFTIEYHDIVSYAAQLHHQLMYIYPYRRVPGLLARLFTNQFMKLTITHPLLF